MGDIVQSKDNCQKNKKRKSIKYNIIIVGAGGFGREVYLWAKDSFDFTKYQIKGFLSNNKSDLDNFDIKVGIIGDPDYYEIKENDRFLFAIGNIETKKRLVTKLKNKGAKFLTLIHPTAIVVSTARIGKGVVICPFCLVSDNVQLDDFVMMNTYASCGHDVKVGKYSILSPYAALNGFVKLEDEVFLGTHTTVIAHKKIGYQSKISANSVVMRDVPPNRMVFGVPGKTI